MEKKLNLPPGAAELRHRAEDRLRKQRPETVEAKTEAETQRLVHKLQVHQVELEMQNEKLRKARAEMEEGLEKYSDLYDFAPVGYLKWAWLHPAAANWHPFTVLCHMLDCQVFGLKSWGDII